MHGIDAFPLLLADLDVCLIWQSHPRPCLVVHALAVSVLCLMDWMGCTNRVLRSTSTGAAKCTFLIHRERVGEAEGGWSRQTGPATSSTPHSPAARSTKEGHSSHSPPVPPPSHLLPSPTSAQTRGGEPHIGQRCCCLRTSWTTVPGVPHDQRMSSGDNESTAKALHQVSASVISRTIGLIEVLEGTTILTQQAPVYHHLEAAVLAGTRRLPLDRPALPGSSLYR